MSPGNDQPPSICRREIALAFSGPEEGREFLIALPEGENASIRISPAEIANYLETNADCQFICYDAAALHWKLVEMFRACGHDNALPTLWDMSRRGRLHDVRLLEQRVRLVEEGVNPLPKSLVDLAKNLCPSETTGATFDAVQAILALYQHLKLRVNKIYAGLRIDPMLRSPFRSNEGDRRLRGLLGHGIDVQGAIAVNSPDRTLRIDVGKAAQLEKRLNELFAQSSRILREDPRATKVFKWDGDVIVRDSSGRICFEPNDLRIWLQFQFDHLADVNNQPWPIPRDDNGKVFWHPEHYESLGRCTALLKAWNDLFRSASLLRFFQSGTEWSVFGEHQVIPRIHSVKPDLSYLHLLAPELFQPPPGKQLVVCRLSDLELRCLGLVSERYRHRSRIAQEFRDYDNEVVEEEDVVKVFAENLWEIEQNSDAEDNVSGNGISESTAISVTSIMFKYIPRGYSVDQIHSLLRDATGAEEEVFPRDRVMGWFTLFKNDICSELTDLLQDSTIALVTSSNNEDFIPLSKRLREAGIEIDVQGATIRNVLIGKTAPPGVREILEDFAIVPPATNSSDRPVPDPKLILQTHPVTPLGSVGPPAYASQARSAEYLNFSADIVKLSLFEFAAAGFTVVAVDDDEFVVTVEADSDLSQDSLKQQLEKLCPTNFLANWGLPPSTRPVPFELTSKFADRW